MSKPTYHSHDHTLKAVLGFPEARKQLQYFNLQSQGYSFCPYLYLMLSANHSKT